VIDGHLVVPLEEAIEIEGVPVVEATVVTTESKKLTASVKNVRLDVNSFASKCQVAGLERVAMTEIYQAAIKNGKYYGLHNNIDRKFVVIDEGVDTWRELIPLVE
jgi:predicted nuclease with RNAse H fold